MTSFTQEDVARVAVGWKHLINSRKWHFFDADGRSLCGGWMTLGFRGELGNDDSPDNCAKCRRKLHHLKETTK